MKSTLSEKSKIRKRTSMINQYCRMFEKQVLILEELEKGYWRSLKY
ncbi:MAG: hypothetical protein AAF363_17370 [Bacteroidota bacterium]